MRKIFPVVAVMAFLVSVFHPFAGLLAQEDGAALFSTYKCDLCHKPDRKGAGPSLKEIAAAYSGKRDQLVKYLKGEAPAVVIPDKASTMAPTLATLGDLSGGELDALAGYFMQPR